MTYPTKKLGEVWSRLFGFRLNVPYIPQINENACGAAVLEMIYRFYGLKSSSQEELFKKYQVLEPHGSGNFRFNTESLVSDALGRGLMSFWARAQYDSPESVIDLLMRLVVGSKIPVIVCHKFTDEQPLIGHFRIVVGIKGDIVYVHDPNIDIGGAFQEWKIQKFLEFWRPTGENVVGGIFVIIKKL